MVSFQGEKEIKLYDPGQQNNYLRTKEVKKAI